MWAGRDHTSPTLEMPHSLLVWKELGSMMEAPTASPQIQDDSHSALSKWLLQWLAQAGPDEKSLMVQGVYAIWLARNDARDGRKIADATEVAKSARHFLLEWEQ